MAKKDITDSLPPCGNAQIIKYTQLKYFLNEIFY